MNYVRERFLPKPSIHDDEHLKIWKEHFTTVINRITSDKLAPFVDEIEQGDDR